MFVHELVAMQANAAPHAVAIVGDQQLTYGDLNSRADRLARRLVSLGVQSEVPVALFLERSPELAIAALAVLMAGGRMYRWIPVTRRRGSRCCWRIALRRWW